MPTTSRAFGTHPLTGGLIGIIVALVMTSCASVSVEEGTDVATQTKPKLIYVMEFSTAQGNFEVDREGQELAQFQHDLQFDLRKAMVNDLSKRLVYAEEGDKADLSKRENAWLIRGEFLTVKQGSRLLRSAVGLGAGGTKMEVHVEVYDLSQGIGKPFLTFNTSGGSNAEPGAAETLSTAPATLVLGGASGAMHGVSEDNKRTAKEITAELSDYMYKRGWIPKDEWIEPKQAHDSNQF